MSKYADVLKNAKDLLSKSFNYDNKVEVKTTTNNGVNFTSETVFGKATTSFLKADFSKGNFKVDKLQLGTDKKLVGEFSLTEAVPNTKLTFKATDGSRAAGADAITASVGAEYKLANGTLTLDVDPLSYNIDTTGLFSAFEGLLVGYSAKGGMGKDSGFGLTDYNALLGYKTGSFTVAAQTEKAMSNVTVGVHHNVDALTAVAAVAKMPLKGAGSFSVEAGLSYKLDKNTTANAKVGSNGKLAFSYAQAIQPFTKLTFAAQIDAANIASEEHKAGLTLNITA